MIHIKYRTALWGIIVSLTAVWAIFTPGVFHLDSFFPLRSAMTQLSGFLATSCMAIALMLAARPRWIESCLGGLDRMYALHKWLGICALVLSLTHWVWTQAPGWAAALELISPLVRPGGERPAILNPVQAFFGQFRGVAEQLGELAFYVSVLLIITALVARIPYRWFLRLHRFFPVVWLIVVVHSVVLTSFAYWSTPVGIILVLLMIGGTHGALLSLFRRIGRKRQVEGKITLLKKYPGVHSFESVVTVGTDWPGHRAGQFAFVVSDRNEGAHPYTIASAWNPESSDIRFVVKELGDYTTGLADRLQVGQQVRVEGPYGCFDFDDDCVTQVWIGGGIGISPFIGRMQELAQLESSEPKPTIHLFHSTADVDNAVLVRLQADADAAGVKLHVKIDVRDGYLSGEEIRCIVPGWKNSSYWFCGPVSFGKTLRADLLTSGVPVAKRFHSEMFELR